jgi:hypothetical protein
MSNEIKPPIKSGWRGNLSGYLEATESSSVKVSEVTLTLDRDTAWALANLLTDNQLNASTNMEKTQIAAMSNLGAAIGRLIDHGAANNGGRTILK